MPIIEYELHKLGWHSFQQLCIAICREIFGQTVEMFLNSADGGRDGAFTGLWKDGDAVHLCGRFVIQCKFTSKRDHLLSKADLADEFKKVKRLVKEGRCDNYIVLTNAGVSGLVAEKIETYFKSAGAKQVRVYGSSWVNEQITENKRLRMLMPRVYGLGDLIEEHISNIEYWIDEHKDAVSLFQPERVGAEQGSSSKTVNGRDIFDDIDE